MVDETVRIERMTLRVPGLSREEGQRLSEEVSRRLAEQLPGELRERRLGELGIRVSVPAGADRDQMTELLTEAILGKLS